MIDLINVKKVYETGNSQKIYAVNNISLKINDGEMVAIIGTSGAGKTSLLKIIGLVEPVTEGEYLFDKLNLTKCSDREAANFRANNISFIMQDFALVGQFSVYENVELQLLLNSEKLSKNDRRNRVMPVLERLGLSNLVNRQATKLSGGQKQRVAIARAIVANSKIVLADEPTGALDSKTSSEIIDILTDLNKKGKTIIIVTHDMKIASQCNRIIEISDGKIISDNQ